MRLQEVEVNAPRGPIRPVPKMASEPVGLYDLSTEGQIALNSILTYRNNRVVERFAMDNECSSEVAESFFIGLMQFIAASVFNPGPQTPSKVIDDIWHTFILHMREYEQFCRERFGGILYHDPATDDSGLDYYPNTRTCVISLVGNTPESVWPENHTRYTLCISCAPDINMTLPEWFKSKAVAVA